MTFAMHPIKRYIFLLIFVFALMPAKLSAQINADQVMRMGQNMLYFGDYELAIQCFNRVIEAKPRTERAYLFKAIALLNLDDYEGAEKEVTKSIEINPFITDSYEVRGVARQNRGDHKGAIEDYDRALNLMVDNRNLLFNKALAQDESGDYEGAMATFNHIVETSPGYDNAYIGRAKVELVLKDTVAALNDINRAIELNKNIPNAYIMRAGIAIDSSKDFKSALEDMDAAIKLLPQMAGLYVNRAYLRYNLDDYFGAMADFDYAITLDPTNSTAYFNRGLLRAEVADNDKAINDFSTVLKIDQSDVRARYNRAMLYRATRNYSKAIDDINKVIEAFPDMSAPLFFRFEIYDEMGSRNLAMRDYDAAMALSKREIASYNERHSQGAGNAGGAQPDAAPEKTPEENAEIFANRFSLLLTADNDVEPQGEYNNKSIRGKVQDYNVSIQMQKPFMLSYYSSPTELNPTTYFMQEIESINSSRALRMLVQIVNDEPSLDDPDIMQRHFDSIEYYNSYLSTHTPRAVDYFGRGMDHLMLRNYEAAVDDMTKAIAIAPDFVLAYYARANALSKLLEVSAGSLSDVSSREAEYQRHKGRMMQIFDDYDHVTLYSPRSPFPYFNRGILYAEIGDLQSACDQFSKAIELKPDFGEAYFNRGFINYKLGNQRAGSSDLSQAGQLGVTQSYNLLKRMK